MERRNLNDINQKVDTGQNNKFHVGYQENFKPDATHSGRDSSNLPVLLHQLENKNANISKIFHKIASEETMLAKIDDACFQLFSRALVCESPKEGEGNLAPEEGNKLRDFIGTLRELIRKTKDNDRPSLTLTDGYF